MLRTLPPVYSPLSATALWRGCRASLSPAVAIIAEQTVRDSLRARGYVGGLIFTDSGTSALALAISLAAKGRPVALPAYGCYDLATAVDAAGLPFLLYDLDPETLGPAAGSVQAAVAAGARAVVVVHLYGLPVAIPPLRAQLPSDVAIVDDAAQGVGATLDGVPLGALGDYGVLSFGRGKGFTGGSGGALLVAGSDQPPALPLASGGTLRAFVATTAQWIVARPGLYALPRALPFLGLGETHYRPPQTAKAINSFSLGVLSACAPQLQAEAEHRRRIAVRYRGALSGHPALTLPIDAAGAGWLRFPVLVKRSALARAKDDASARLGIMPGYPKSLADLERFGERRMNAEEAFPGACTLAERLFTLPTHGALAERDVEAVITRLQSLR